MARLHIRGRGWVGATLATAAIVLLLTAAGWGVPSTDPRPAQFGLASWYGPGFHGEETASGEIFDQQEMVAAHRTLPLGSVIRVTNLQNGRRVTLRVIDRGPYGRNYRRGTIVDVSRGAARRLQFLKKGLTRVRVDVVSTPGTTRGRRL